MLLIACRAADMGYRDQDTRSAGRAVTMAAVTRATAQVPSFSVPVTRDWARLGSVRAQASGTEPISIATVAVSTAIVLVLGAVANPGMT